MQPLLKTQEVARICQVAQGTVIRWIKQGKLPASSTAGGHNRVNLEDLVGLLKNLRMPIPAELTQNDKFRILIIDDDPQIKNLISSMLKQSFKNILIEDAAEGVIAGWKAHSFRPDLVILDLKLPGIDGFQVCMFIRQIPDLQETKIIAVSGLPDPETREQILSAGADEFLAKPFKMSELKKQIQTLAGPKLGGVVA